MMVQQMIKEVIRYTTVHFLFSFMQKKTQQNPQISLPCFIPVSHLFLNVCLYHSEVLELTINIYK